MFRSPKLRRKFTSFLTLISLVLNMMQPALLALTMPTPAYAEELPAPTDSPTPTPEATVAPSADPTPEPTPEVTPVPEPTLSPEPSAEASSAPDPSTSPDASLEPIASIEPSIEPSSEPTPAPSDTPTNPQPTQDSSPAPPAQDQDDPAQRDDILAPTPAPTPTPELNEQLSISILDHTAASSIEEFDLTVTETGSATLSTDKADYAPTDTALITGSGFLANTTYSLTISSTDNPATSTTASVTTDAEGTLFYAYQLDGVYRPDYQVVAYLGSTFVARITFTDGPISGTVIDSAGANDEPGQKDLTKMFADYSGLPSSVFVQWNWDEIKWTGNNTGDGCALFDTDNDGYVNYSLCVIISGDPATYSSKALYSCGDNAANKCTSPVTTLSPSGSTSCNATGSTDDPFTDGDEYNKDTKASCTIALSDVGGAGVAQLVDVCSYPSGQPNSDPSDCIVFRTSSGKVEVIKNLVPSGDSGFFNLQINSTTYATNVGNTGTTGEQVVDIGTTTFGETAGTATSLSDYTSSASCQDLNGTGASVAVTGTGPWSIDVENGKDIVCTITNTRVNNGSITVIKDAAPDSAQDFAFTATGTGLSNFSLDDDADVTLSNTRVFSSLSSGNYSVTETVPAGWDQTSATCTDGSNPASIALASGESVTCTFVNTERGHIIVDKVTSPSGDPQSFSFLASGGTSPEYADFSLTDAALANDQVLKPGFYGVSETVPTDWEQSDLTCVSSLGDTEVAANLELGAGETITCTYTNTKLGKILVTKQTLPDDDPALFDFTASYDGDGFVLSDGQTNDSGYLVPGTYSVAETGEAGWSLTGTSCSDQSSISSISLAPGETVTCTFTNTKLGSISGFKFNDLNGDGNWDAGEPGASGWLISLLDEENNVVDAVSTDANGFYSFDALLPGIYSLIEDLLAGWTQTGAPSGVVLSAGEESEDNNFFNFEQGVISGYKYHDLNRNGARDQNEPTLPGWEINLTGAASDSVLTNQAGYYEFTNLGPGTYHVSETNQAGWSQEEPTGNDHEILMTSGGNFPNTNFGNFFIDPELSIDKMLSTTTSPEILVGDTASFTITITNDGNVTLSNPVIYDTYDASYLEFVSSSPVAPLTHSTAVPDAADYDNDGDITELIRTLTWEVPVDLEPGDTYVLTVNFTALQPTLEPTLTGNEAYSTACYEGCSESETLETPTDNAFVDIDELGSIAGFKWVDSNGDGVWDNGETYLNGVTIELRSDNDTLLATTVTTGSGAYGFTNLSSGDYKVCELAPTGYVQTYPATCHAFGISDDGENLTNYNFGNQGQGTIIVEKDVVPDSEATFDFKIEGALIETIGFVLGDDDNATYSQLPAGSYTLTETSDSLYTTQVSCVSSVQDSESADVIDLDPGETITCSYTNTRKTGDLLIHKIIDIDGNLATTEDQSNGAGWYFGIEGNSEDTTTFPTDSTDANGLLTYLGVQTGNYDVQEFTQDGYDLVMASCGAENGSLDGNIIYGIDVEKDDSVTCTFYNSPNGTLHGYKWNDENGDGEVSDGEDKLAGWTINLYQVAGEEQNLVDSFVTDSGNEHFGWYWFEHLFPGDYKVCEEPQDGWQQTYPLEPACHFMTLPDDNSDNFEVTQNAVLGPEYNFGNQTEPSLTIEKTNDATGTKSPGDTVLYTLTVALEGSALSDVQVTDVTPEGFDYVPGSWTSSKPGVLEPSYSSPGVWNLGDMNPGDLITLTYLAKIKSDLDGGNYLDTAWAQGESKGWGILLAQGQNSEYVDGYFVGTDVFVGQNMHETGSVDIEGEVLGAATELPATGVNSLWLFLALGLLVSGLFMLIGGRYMKKIIQIAIILVIGHWSLAIPAALAADADNNLSTRLESPLSPTRDNDWLLAFSVLDRQSRTPSVACYVKKPGEGSFNQFDSTKVSSKVMGDNMSCHVSGSLMSAQGNYEFYVVTTSGTDSEESSHVTVTYDTEGPDRPVSYAKEHPWACRYTIKFKTADDGGKTTSVEVYGSKSTTFNTDNSTRIGGVSIGSNQEGSLNHDLVGDDCNQTWYYVIRAFDSTGNQSAHLGDEVVSVAASPVTPSSAPFIVNNSGVGSVLGSEIADEESEVSPTPTTSPSNVTGQGLVAGASEAMQKTVKNKSFWWIVLLVIVLRLLYGITRRQ